MNVYHIDINKVNKELVCCIGFFDGLHLGHQKLVAETNILAKKLNVESALITFAPDPWVVTKKIKKYRHINDYASKLYLLKKFKIDNLIIIKFSDELSKLESKKFIKLLENNIKLKGLVYGFDFNYGFKGQGNKETIINELSKDIKHVCVLAVEDNQGKISSSRIEEALSLGNIKLVNDLLGYKYFIIGKVKHGNKLGRTINFRTANIILNDDLLTPKVGVYQGYLKYDNNYYKAIINIGHNPTFNYQEKVSLEVHIIDFDLDIYDQEVIVFFNDYLRDEKIFNSKDDLIKELEKNKISANLQGKYTED